MEVFLAVVMEIQLSQGQDPASLPYSQFHAGFNRFMQMAQTDL